MRTGWHRRFTVATAERRVFNFRRQMSLREVRQILSLAPRSEWGVVHKLSRFARHAGHPLNELILLDDAVYGEQVVNRELGKFMIDAHSIWPRLPYLDARVGIIADRVAPEAKMAAGPAGQLEFKHFFKEVMRKHAVLPEEIIFWKKAWMTSPTADWLREDLCKIVEAILLGDQARATGYFNLHEIERRLNEHRAGVANHMFCLMMLTCFELWHRIFIDAPTVGRPTMTLRQMARNDFV